MRRWIETLSKGPFLSGLVVTLVTALLAVFLLPIDETLSEDDTPVIYRSASADHGATEVGRHEDASVHHLKVTEAVRAHYHQRHDETVVVLGGEGRLHMGDRIERIEKGAVFLLPRGTVHSVEIDNGPLEAVSIFSPPFDGEDRHFVD